MRWLSLLKNWAGPIKRDVAALYLAARGPRAPWCAKAVATAIAAYALRSIGLILDIIPILGLLDDLLVLPLGIMIAIELIPPKVMAEHRAGVIVVGDEPAGRLAAASGLQRPGC